MPITSYCRECGAKTVADTTPNLCCKCGTPFFSYTSVSVIKPRVTLPKEATTDIDEEGTDVYSVPTITEPQFSVDYVETSRGVTLGEINNQNQGKKNKKKKVKQSSAPDKAAPNKPREDILATFRQEAGNENKPASID